MLVGPVGPRDAKLAIVGEAPGEREVAQRQPFVGPAGNVLNTALRQAGIRREECYITNLMQTRPEGNNFGQFYLDGSRQHPSEALLRGIERVKHELAVVNPNVTLLCGAEPMRAFLGHRDISSRRGYVVDTEWGKMLPTYHPAVILHGGKDIEGRSYYPLFCFDVAKARRESLSAVLHLPQRTLLLRPPVKEALHQLARMEASASPVVFDIETDPKGSEWYCIAFCDTSGWAMCLPTSPNWNVDAAYVEAVRPAIKSLLENPKVPKIAQNAQFDVLFLRAHHGIKTTPIVFDTMTAHHTVYPELPKSLELLCSLYTDHPYYKDMERIPPSLWEYNALDTIVTYDCYLALVQELKELGVTDFYREYVLPLIEPLLEMQEQGVCVDLTQRTIVAKQLQEDLHDTEAELTHLAYGWTIVQTTRPGLASSHVIGLNAHSPKQLQDYLFRTLRLPAAYKRKTGTLTTDEDSLQKLAKKYQHPSIPLILSLRQMQKLLSTYVLAPLGADARLRCSYVVGGTETGRLASRQSIFGTGTNLQNVPHGIARRLLVPRPGAIFVQADLSQAEARIVAYLAQDERLIDLFTRGGDIHRENAAHLFHQGDLAQVTKQERQVAKKLVHAANYGIGPIQFQDVLRNEAQVEVTKVESERLLNLYHARFPKIRSWHAMIEAELQQSRILASPVGRKRRFFGRWNDELLREGYAHVPQSTVADLLNRGLIELHQKLPSVDHTARLVLTVHDSVVVECRPTHVRPVARLIRQCLERPITIHRRSCLIPCDIKTGLTWQDLEPLDES